MRIVHARHIVSTLVIARTSKLWKQASTAPSRAGRVHHQPQLHLQRNIVSILAIARSSKLWNQRSIAPPTTTRSHIRHNHQHQRRSFSLATTNDNNTPRTATDLAENTTTSESTMTSDVGADALITTVVTTSRGMAPPKVEQKTSFYRRPLSAPCVAFSSVNGRRLFREALVEGNMESYFRLAEQFRTQDDPAFCGLSTLTMVLNALAIDPGRIWKGPWRWYHESMLDCCAPLDVVRKEGVTLDTDPSCRADSLNHFRPSPEHSESSPINTSPETTKSVESRSELVCLARCNGLDVNLRTPDTHTIDHLRADIEECCSQDLGKVVVVSYDRRGLKQTGSGHFSPVGSYHKAEDLVLIMDTARFKLPPHWVPLSMLWGAMKTIDPETGRPRGFMVLQKSRDISHRLFTDAPEKYRDWPQVVSWVREVMQLASRSSGAQDKEERTDDAGGGLEGVQGLTDAKTVGEFVSPLLACMPPEVHDLLTMFNATGQSRCAQAQDGFVLQAIQGTEAYHEIARIKRMKPVAANSKKTSDQNINGDGSSRGSGGDRAPACTTIESRPASGVCPTGPEVSCGCSMRHTLAILTYALLSLLHNCEAGVGSAGGARPESINGNASGTGAGETAQIMTASAWSEDPLAGLPDSVANEARHVANILQGLVDMDGAKVMQSRPPKDPQQPSAS